MGIVENVKAAADVAKKFGNIELYRQIVELEGEVIELTREKHQLEQTVEELNGKLAVKQRMQFKEPFYWQEGDNNPFCPNCWETQHQAIHLFHAFTNAERTRWDCKTCKNSFLLDQNASQETSRHFWR